MSHKLWISRWRVQRMEKAPQYLSGLNSNTEFKSQHLRAFLQPGHIPVNAVFLRELGGILSDRSEVSHKASVSWQRLSNVYL